MKVLYGIQGTGNGHLSRARKIVPILKEFCEVDTVLSGNQSQVSVDFPIDYSFNGLSFHATKKGKVDILNSFLKSQPLDLIRDIRQFPVQQYDLVISDFEPISSWSALLKGVPCVELSHNVAVAHSNSPKPPFNDRKGKFVLTHYCPSELQFGFHFKKYTKNTFLPVIRDEVRALETKSENYFVVYLPAYHDTFIFSILSQFDVPWVVFSKYTKTTYQKKNITFQPIENDSFLAHLAQSQGVLCGAGFELPAEVLHLGKKLMVIPMKGQYEQWCNAHALKELGVSMLPKLDITFHRTIKNWIQFTPPIHVPFPDTVRHDIQYVLNEAQSFFFCENRVSKRERQASVRNIWNHKFG
ncbi:MAG: hypothetical protein RL264_1885 [Bacteroidota bacterium]|jgi:uncharacterized protein (TIGR00661 family)